MRLRGFVPIFLCLLAPSIGLADMVDIGAAKDNTLYESTDGTIRNGAGEHLRVGGVRAM